MSTSARIQIRRDTAANWTSANPVLAVGEPAVETDTGYHKIGDGVTAWASLAYVPVASSQLPSAVANAVSRVFDARDYGVKADGKTVTDGVLTGNQLSSASAAFTTADAGKLIVILGAGTPTSTTLNETLSTGTPKTTLTVLGLPALIAAGGIILDDGAGHTQKISQTGAANGATSIPLSVSTTPNFNYPSGTTTVTTMTPALVTTIQSVSGGVATLAASAGTNIASSAEVFYASNDTTAAQACITAAQAVNGIAQFQLGQIGINAALVMTGGEVHGRGVYELYGSGSGGYNAFGNVPTVAPYISGTVIVQCAAATDVIQRNGVGVPQNITKIGLRHAGKFVNTGHGINDTPPALSGHSDSSAMASTLEDVVVYGHDGNHYAFSLLNNMLPQFPYIRAFGGGGMHFAQSSTAGNYGNVTSSRFYFNCFVAGTAHVFHLDNQAGSVVDYCQFFHPQCWLQSPAASGGVQPANTVAPTVAQFLWNTTGGHQNIGVIGPDMESNIAGAKVQRPSGVGCYWIGDDTTSSASVVNALPRGAQPGLDQGLAAPVSGTSYQNLWGTELITAVHFVLTPAAAATATGTLASSSAYKAVTLSVTGALGAGFAAGQGVQIDTGANTEYRIVASVATNSITFTTPLLFAHNSGVTVQSGAAVGIVQSLKTSLSGNQTSTFVMDEFGAPIGDTVGRFAKLTVNIPSAWFVRWDWANATFHNIANATAAR